MGQVDWDVIKGALTTLALMVLLAAVLWYGLTHVPESPAAAEPLSRKVQREVGT